MKSAINALTLFLAVEVGVAIADAMPLATRFVEENAELFGTPSTAERAAAIVKRAGPQPADLREPGQPLDGEDGPPRAVKHYVPVVGPDGLTDVQRKAMETGVGLCPNCQQPKNRHLPGCARASGEDPKAVTKTRLPAVQ